MPELDHFDLRIEHAVHAFADRAQTSVDAVAVAARAMGRRQTGPWAVLVRAVPVPVSLIAVSAVLLAFAGWSISGGGPFPVRIWLGPVATPTAAPTPAPTPSPTPTPVLPTPTPIPPPDGQGDDVVAGSEIVGLREGVMTIRASMNDPRVDGTGTWQVDTDLRDGTGPAWGGFRLDNAGGAWEGSCTGSLWEGGTAGIRSCWLQGSGDYEGYTYQLTVTWSDQGSGDVRGVIVPGSRPEP
jgi:hypothetical protein